MLSRAISRSFKRAISNDTVVNLKQDDSFSKNLMKAWAVSSYGKSSDLKITDVKIPTLKKPSDVLIKISATSLNPIDAALLGGYGRVVLDNMRKLDPNMWCFGHEACMPLTPGRDFAGVIVAKGTNVRPELQIGDPVYAVIPPHMQGCHSEYAIADSSHVCRKPDSMSMEEASGLLYAGVTAWSALRVTGGYITTSSIKNAKVLVLGGCGGVGHMAIQLLKAWGANVASTCKTDGIPMLETFGTDIIIDYSDKDYKTALQNVGKFDMVLDTRSGPSDPAEMLPLLKEWKGAKVITLKSPLLTQTDSLGLVAGAARSAVDLLTANLASGALPRGTSVRWAYFMPIPPAISDISTLAANKQLKPVVEKVFRFQELPEAYSLLEAGHRRGKLVVKLDNQE